MFEIILNTKTEPKNYLPQFKLTPSMMTETARLYLDFITNLYIGSAKNTPSLNDEDQMWFLEQIALYIKNLNPAISKDDHVYLITKVIEQHELIKKGKL